ncbi:MAG: hypothetical protein HeimC2_09300 [Candidatus Heimdallarchaeota archaeon LC_2]|nr:MAG: hypothetical protein HeimC2_33330 [Candidatus Heimdallarchaeota archaeon LC_2]OLS28025.1 MAG: hypothetical protein HeimC2_09300 [Candidatus Heimdallarchaeota archaeon LC_2]
MNKLNYIYQKVIFIITKCESMPISNEDVIVQNLLNKIIFVALEDGIITEDELAILKQVKIDVKTIRDRLKSIGSQLEEKSTEAKLLNEFSKDVVQNAYNISQNDRVITDDERKLINTLIKALIN